MDDSAGPSWGLILFSGLLIIDFIFSMYSSALENVSDNFLDEAAENGNERAEKVHKLKSRADYFVYACWLYLILTAFSAVSAAWTGTSCEGGILSSPAFRAILFSVIVFVFGEALPRMFGKKYRNSCSLRCYGFVHVFTAITMPFSFVLINISMLIGFMFGIRKKDLDDEVTEDEIISMVNEGHEQGVLDKNETEMINNIFELDDKQARDIMTHRKDICGIDADYTLGQAIDFMSGRNNSRFPVYDGTIDNIIGVLHYRDAMRFSNSDGFEDKKLRDIPGLLLPVKFIPETRQISVLFKSMQAQKLQMVIVVDEYGETAGLVTMEDILEEIVGNIFDEYDEDEMQIIREDDGSYIMDGMTPLSDVEEELGIKLNDEEHETLNGYLIYKLDRIPDEHETSVIEADGYAFRIIEVKNNTIRWVHVRKLNKEETENKDSGRTREEEGRGKNRAENDNRTDSKKDEE